MYYVAPTVLSAHDITIKKVTLISDDKGSLVKVDSGIGVFRTAKENLFETREQAVEQLTKNTTIFIQKCESLLRTERNWTDK